MSFNYSKAYDVRGAQMGRPDCYGDGVSNAKLHLEKVPMDRSGCYDPGGAYWGIGTQLYVAYDEDDKEVVEIFCRASSREAAKVLVQSRRKNVRFYR